MKKYKIPALLLHILLLLLALTMFFRAIATGARGGETTVAYVFAGITVGIAVVDMVFVYFKLNRIWTIVALFVFACIMFVLLWASTFMYGAMPAPTIEALRNNLLYMCLLLIASAIYGYFVSAKIIDKE